MMECIVADKILANSAMVICERGTQGFY